MTARREVRGWAASIDDFRWHDPQDYAVVASEPFPDDEHGPIPQHPVVLMHADDHAALVAEVEEWRANAAALMEEVRGYEAASASEHTTDTPTDAEGHTEDDDA